MRRVRRRSGLAFLGATLLAVLAPVAPVGCAPARASLREGPPLAGAPFARAEIYFIPWDVVTAAGLSPETVRQARDSFTVLKEPAQIAELLRVLDLGGLRRPASKPQFLGDFRLVVDLTRPDGTMESLAADTGRLVRLPDGALRGIDAAFRSRFSRKEW